MSGGPRGGSVELAAIEDGDLECLFEWINDRDLALASAGYAPTHEHDHREWFDAVRSRDDTVIFAIRELEDGGLVGTCQLTGIGSRHRVAELRIRIGTDEARGRGFGTEAVRLLLDHAFDDLDLHRVELHVFADNEAAIGVYQKAGMRAEGTLRERVHVGGERKDVVLMGILADEHRTG